MAATSFVVAALLTFHPAPDVLPQGPVSRDHRWRDLALRVAVTVALVLTEAEEAIEEWIRRMENQGVKG